MSSFRELVRAADRLPRLVAVFHLLYIYVRSLARRYLFSGPDSAASTCNHGPDLYRVYAFNEGEEPGFFRELAPASFDSRTWEADVRESTGWARFRVELRYTFRHKKYRMVLRPGDACPLPMYAEPSAPACRLPKGVISARLQGPPGSEVDCDVTHRVLKYQGPRGDFHAGLGLHVRVQDMFPFDDHTDNSSRFSHLRIMDTTARLQDIPYGENRVPPAIPSAPTPPTPRTSLSDCSSPDLDDSKDD